MLTVTQWIKSPLCKQPKGGLIPINLFSKKTLFNSPEVLCPQEKESIPPRSVGDLIDYLTRYVLTNGNISDTFRTCESGFKLAKQSNQMQFYYFGKRLFDEIYELQKKLFQKSKDTYKHLTIEFVGISYELLSGNIRYRSGKISFPNRRSIDQKTLKNIQIMIYRTIQYLKNKSLDGILYPGVFFKRNNKNTSMNWISDGDADFLTSKELIELKTSKYSVKNDHALQTVIYYLLGKEWGDTRFDSVESLCIFNPRLNEEYFLDISKIPPQRIREIYRQW